jgi:hypothetical protein
MSVRRAAPGFGILGFGILDFGTLAFDVRLIFKKRARGIGIDP